MGDASALYLGKPGTIATYENTTLLGVYIRTEYRHHP